MPSKALTVDENAVRTRAYLMWEADGRPDGRADHYWGLAYAEAAAKPKRAAASAKSSVPEKKARPKAAAKPAKAAPKAKKPKA